MVENWTSSLHRETGKLQAKCEVKRDCRQEEAIIMIVVDTDQEAVAVARTAVDTGQGVGALTGAVGDHTPDRVLDPDHMVDGLHPGR